MKKREAGRLLCDCLSGRTIPEARLSELSPPDGESLADHALDLKVGGLFYREIRSGRFPADLVPVDARNRLREAYRNQATRNTSLFLDAAKVIGSLTDHQLPVIALKGLSLARHIYGDIALRPMSDMDLLVKEEDLVKAGRILLTLGYAQSFPAWEGTLEIYHHLPPFVNKRGTIIELHWNIVTPDSPIRVDLDGLWKRACLLTLGDVEVGTFSPEDQLLHLCIHACFHIQTGLDLIPLCDVAGMIRASAGTIDWQIVVERAIGWGGRKCVYLMLLLVRELLGAAPPDEVLSAIAPDDYQSVFLDEAVEQVFDVIPSAGLTRKRLGKLSQIGRIRGMRGKLLAVWKGAFPSRQYLARIYPVSDSSLKIYLCYLSRLRLLIVNYSITLLRWFGRDRSVIRAVHQEERVSALSGWMFS